MPRPKLTRDLAWAAATDAADAHMRRHGRDVWSQADADVCVATLERLWPPCRDGFKAVCACPDCQRCAKCRGTGRPLNGDALCEQCGEVP